MYLPDLIAGDGINSLALNTFPVSKVSVTYKSGNIIKAPGKCETNVDSLTIRAILEQEAGLLFLLQGIKDSSVFFLKTEPKRFDFQFRTLAA